MRRNTQNRFDGKKFGRTFLATLFVTMFILTVVQSLLERKSLVEGLWLFLKLLPWGILMVFLVALSMDKNLLFEDDEEDDGFEIFEVNPNLKE